MKMHPDVLAAHAEFGGDLESMQRCYEWYDLVEHQQKYETLITIINDRLKDNMTPLAARHCLSRILAEAGETNDQIQQRIIKGGQRSSIQDVEEGKERITDR